jgi:hypothetical protein
MTSRERLEVMLGRCLEAGASADAEAIRRVLAYWPEPGRGALRHRCPVCGEPFAVRPGSGRKPTFCSPACRIRARRERNGKGAPRG